MSWVIACRFAVSSCASLCPVCVALVSVRSVHPVDERIPLRRCDGQSTINEKTEINNNKSKRTRNHQPNVDEERRDARGEGGEKREEIRENREGTRRDDG